VRRDDLPWVFFRDTGQPVRSFRRSWKTASHQAGLPIEKATRKTFHDLRRTTARDLNRAGVPDPIAMAIMGHKTRAMYDRYNIVDEGDISTALTQAETYRARRVYNRATSGEAQEKQEVVSKT